MSNRFVINLEKNFKIEKNHPYTICFKATCPTYHHGIFNLKYTGTELLYDVTLPKDYMDEVLLKMQEYFKYGPFDKNVVKEVLNEQMQFCVED